jgi:hypothetical protein
MIGSIKSSIMLTRRGEFFLQPSRVQHSVHKALTKLTEKSILGLSRLFHGGCILKLSSCS